MRKPVLQREFGRAVEQIVLDGLAFGQRVAAEGDAELVLVEPDFRIAEAIGRRRLIGRRRHARRKSRDQRDEHKSSKQARHVTPPKAWH